MQDMKITTGRFGVPQKKEKKQWSSELGLLNFSTPKHDSGSMTGLNQLNFSLQFAEVLGYNSVKPS